MNRVFPYLSIMFFIAGAYLFTRPEDIGSNLPLFYSGVVVCALGYIGILIRGIPFAKKYWIIGFWLLVIVPRLFALNLIPSDDLARYLWEGKVLREGYSPYAYPPESEEFAQYRGDEVYQMINHKDKPAIYPPLTHYIFALLSIFIKSANGIRIFLLMVELAVIFLMLKWLKGMNISRDRAFIYALNPLVIIGIAGHGHLDSLQLLFLVTGFLFYSRGNKGLCIIFVTLAGMIKFLAFAALPFFITRKTIKYVPLIALVIISIYAPIFLMKGNFTFGNMGIYLGSFEFYSMTFAPLRLLLGTDGALWVSIIIVLLSAIGLWLTRTNPLQAIAPMFLIITLMTTTVHYWYLIPVLAIAVVWPTRYLIALSLLFLPYFDVFGLFISEHIWRGALWRQLVTYVPFIIIFWIEMTGRWPRLRKKDYSVGAVIPVYNDAESLKELLDSLSDTGVDKNNVVISDGGSEDESAIIAEKWGARIIRSDKASRGYQIARGVEALDTDLVVILHADNRVERDLFDKIKKSADAYPCSAGGACRLVYKQRNIRMRLLSYLSNIKMSLFGASFGDQGQWFRNKSIRIPEIPLMEDVETAIRLNDTGPAIWTPAKVYVSTRRYGKVGLWRGILTVIEFSVSYLFRRRWNDEEIDTSNLYKKYYAVKS